MNIYRITNAYYRMSNEYVTYKTNMYRTRNGQNVLLTVNERTDGGQKYSSFFENSIDFNVFSCFQEKCPAFSGKHSFMILVPFGSLINKAINIGLLTKFRHSISKIQHCV